jgi:16S rRNA (adenine1518-N6/adenine1519-N6)-dimethyltransferase
VQREVADRFFAPPSTKAYGAVSVLIQLVAERTGFHPVSRNVFRPRPNVDSAVVAFRRTGLPDDFAQVKRIVEAAFGHRRKKLANSLELSGVDTTRAPIPDARAEELAPAEFLELARELR